jgi:hypothetical protein
MKKATGLRKLILVRETIQPLQSDELENVHGGLTPTVSVVVSAASRASSAACIRAVTEGVKWTARAVSRATVASAAAWSLAHRSEHCSH